MRPSASRPTLAALLFALIVPACDVNEESEVRLGAQAAQEIDAEVPLVEDATIVAYVSQLGQQIARHTERSDLQWRFRVVDSPQINAFALPGGFIYLNRGLIEATQSVSELAGVLGHEIGHVVQRHSMEQMRKHAGANVGIAVLCSVTNVCDSEAGQIALQVGGSFVLARYSRRDEFEADSEAVVNVLRAGFDPGGVPRFFSRLLELRESQPNALESWFASHPLEESRISAAESLIESVPEAQAAGLTIDTDDYGSFRARVAALPPSPRPRRPEEIGSPLP